MLSPARSRSDSSPKLDVYGKVDPKKATPAGLRGQAVFFGKGTCASCHVPLYYTDNLAPNLQAERFFKPVLINSMMAIGDGSIKTFPLRGIKDSPPYLHDGRLLTPRHGGVLQSRSGDPADRPGEGRPGRVPPRPLNSRGLPSAGSGDYRRLRKRAGDPAKANVSYS